MNANFGVVLKKADRERFLSALPRETRTWGDEVIDVGEVQYEFAGLEKTIFQIYPVTKFILDRLPAPLNSEELEYAWMSGSGLDTYERWLQESPSAIVEMHPFESGLATLIGELSFSSVMFAPEGERLGDFVSIKQADFIPMLRENVRGIATSNGFLATIEKSITAG